MRVNAMRNELDSDELVFAIQKTISAMTRRLKMALPRGWRLVVKVACESGKEAPPHELMYLDVQADEGGGSWAEAKIQTLEKCPGWTATHPMEIEEIRNTLDFLGFDDEVISEADCYTDLTPEDIKWLVDVENGPGLAPGFGGIKIPYQCNFVQTDSNRGLVAESGEILIAFSGAAAWQDLQFALAVAREMRDHWNEKKDEFLTMDFEPLKTYPEIEFWMVNLGLQ